MIHRILSTAQSDGRLRSRAASGVAGSTAPSTDLQSLLRDETRGLYSGPDGLLRAFAYCEKLARSQYENFPSTSRFAPSHLRPHVWAIYAFVCGAAALADENAEAFADWEVKLDRCFHGDAEHPIFVALRETVDKCDIPIQPLRDLLTAFGMDLSVHRYRTWSELMCYAAHAAHPVGRLVLYVFDYRDTSLHNYADDFCVALMLANLWQNVGADLDRDRVYLPEEDRKHFGVSDDALGSRVLTPQFRDLMRYEVARARALFERGRPLIDKVGGDLGFELAMMWQGGITILDKIEAVGYDVFHRRPALKTTDKARIIARAATQRWPQFSR
jgi:squalene synthase HpnC